MRRARTRREFLALTGAGAAAFILGCSDEQLSGPAALVEAETTTEPTATSPPPTPTSTPSPTPSPDPTPHPAGHELRTWLAGTEWETEVSIRASGRRGPTIVVLGGAHGNEPGGYYAADEVMNWEPETGVLAVAPRLNTKAINTFQRLIDGEGDLNRQYPGDRGGDLPTSRVVAEITALAHELHADLLVDLHESWAFYADREAAGFVNRQQAGTAYLGQTITGGIGPLHHEIAGRLAAIVNASISSEREHFIPRDGRAYGRSRPLPSLPDGSPDGAGYGGGRGRSSLALGGHVPGLTPVLVETAQQDVTESQRVEYHLAIVRAAMEVMATA